MTEAWKTRIAVGLGLVVLVVPSVTILTLSDSAFRAQCKAQCEPYGLTYRVLRIGQRGAVGDLRYPADCHCIRHDERKAVEIVRDLVW